jgi:hypothetical protein
MFVINATISNLAIITMTTVVITTFPVARDAKNGVRYLCKSFFLTPNKADGLKIFTPNLKHKLALAD